MILKRHFVITIQNLKTISSKTISMMSWSKQPRNDTVVAA